MIEVLVTIAIIVIGVLGLMRMQANLQLSEMESYQRTQAIMLLNDMKHRIATNRAYLADYKTINPLGEDFDCGGMSTTNAYDVDKKEWCEAIQGAAEVQITGSALVGAMIGGRGCIEDITTNEYRITVAWKGLTPLKGPASITCGSGEYDEPGTVCVDDLCRRYVTTVIRAAELNL